VLNAGAIVEKGTHDDLLIQKGLYASMWERQIRAEKALMTAREAQLKAARALRRANMGGQKQAEASGDGYTSLASSGSLPGSGVQDRSGKSEEPTSASSAAGSASSSDTESTHTDEQPEGRRDSSDGNHH
jgi:hypothetical protein